MSVVRVDFQAKRIIPPVRLATGYDPHARAYLNALRNLVDAMIELDEVSRRAEALIAEVDCRPSDAEPPSGDAA